MNEDLERLRLALLAPDNATPEENRGFLAFADRLSTVGNALFAAFLAVSVLAVMPLDRLTTGNNAVAMTVFLVWRLGAFAICGLTALVLWQEVRTGQYLWKRWLIPALWVLSTYSAAVIVQLGGLEQPWVYAAYAVPGATVQMFLPLRQRAITLFGLQTGFLLGLLITRPQDLGTPLFYMYIVMLYFTGFAYTAVGHGVYRMLRANWLQSRALERERLRADTLLRNVLPEPIAERLKSGEGAIADHFDEATVLFADLVGFTSMARDIPATELVAFLNDLFLAFDALADRHGLEKIKTIGDAYMVAGGIPEKRSDHAAAVARMALDMQKICLSLPGPRGEVVQIRIGIASGPVVAGVIGSRKFIYDLWGDTVNTASRMESHGSPGAIQVTASARYRLGPEFRVDERAEIEVKGKGWMKTWWLVGVDTPAPAPVRKRSTDSLFA